MRVDIYSDVLCPWCYIGKRRFERALAQFPGRDDVQVRFRPYQLDPDAPTTAEPLADYLTRRFGPNAAGMRGHVGRTAAAEGITIDWDRALAVNTFDAHRMLRLAEREHGLETQRALADRLFDAHFSRGLNVGDHAQLAALAAEVGMDAGRAAAFLASDEDVAALRDELADARAIGVQAVPTFVLEEQYAVEGGQPPEVFLQVLEEVQRRSAA